MEEVVDSSPRGGRNFSHGKLSKINTKLSQQKLIRVGRSPFLPPTVTSFQHNGEHTQPM